MSKRLYRLGPAEAWLIDTIRARAEGVMMILTNPEVVALSLTGKSPQNYAGAGKSFSEAWAALAPVASVQTGANESEN